MSAVRLSIFLDLLTETLVGFWRFTRRAGRSQDVLEGTTTTVVLW